MRPRSTCVLAAFVVFTIACAKESTSDNTPSAATATFTATSTAASVSTAVTTGATVGDSMTSYAYYVDENKLYRIEAKAGAKPIDLSAELDKLGSGTRDRFASPTIDGAWVVMISDRGGCDGECIVRFSGDLKKLELVKPGDADVYPEGMTAISPTGNSIVFGASDGPHEFDLYRTDYSGGKWSAPALLTGDSTYDYNHSPAISLDGARIHFDCGEERYPESGGNDACEVTLEGKSFKKLVGPDKLASPRFDKVQFPHLGPDGLLFEASWPVDSESPELIWLLPTAGGDPKPFSKGFNNSVSPCPLSDGRMFMLWLGRSGNTAGSHELTLLARDGTLVEVLTPGLDIDDIGIGCGG